MSPDLNADSVRPVCQVVVIQGRHVIVHCGHPLPCPEHGSPLWFERQIDGDERA